jgi:hypothetical protein
MTLMRIFTDNAGRPWSLAIHVDAAKRVRDLAKIDIMELIEAADQPQDGPRRRPLLERILRDPIVLCDLLYAAVKPEADKLGITDQDFGRAMGGGAIAAARQALVEELADFFPEEAPVIRRQAEKLQAAYRNLVRKLEIQIDGMDLDQTVEAALALAAAGHENALRSALPTAGTSSGSWPASAASTPDPARSPS